jgi:hypothetical protein
MQAKLDRTPVLQVATRHPILWMIALLILLTACANNASDSEQPTIAVVEATSVVTEGTTTVPATEVPTSLPVAVATPTPVTGAQATEPATPTPAPTESPPDTGPESNIEQGIAAIIALGYEPRLLARYPSPDEAIEAQVLVYDCVSIIEGQENALDVLRIVNNSTNEITQEVDTQFQYCGGLGAFGLGGLFWSPSGRFFYYTDAREGVPDGCGYWSRPISRVDTTDWSIEELGGVAQSQDGTRLAGWSDEDLVIWDIDGEEIGRVEIARRNLSRGPIVWSPEGNSIAYLLAEHFCVPGSENESTVGVVDVSDFSAEVLLTSNSPAYQDIAWYGSEQLVLADGLGGRWFLDLATGSISETP